MKLLLASLLSAFIFLFAQASTFIADLTIQRFQTATSIRYELSALPENETYSLAEAIDHIESLPEFFAQTPLISEQETYELPDDFKERGANCSSFIKNDNTYGPNGLYIHNAFLNYTNPKHIQILLRNDMANAYSMPQLCPNYAKFDGETRIRFWVWTFAAIAWEESTCKDGAINRGGTNDVAVGLLQLEKTKSNRYWRGPLCNVPEVQSPQANLKCGLEIMRGQFDGTYGQPAGLSIPNSYWQRLRAKWSKIDYLISLFPNCA